MRQARRYVMRVRPDGALRVTIPRGGSQAEALRFAERHIATGRVRQRIEGARGEAAGRRRRQALKAQAAAELPPRLLELAARHGLTVNARHDPQPAIALGLVLVAAATSRSTSA